MQLMNEVSVELTSILELEKLLDKIAQIVRRFIDYDLFAILLIDEIRQEFVCETAVGFNDESLQDLRRLKIHEGLVGRAVRTGSPVLVGEVQGESEFKPVRTWSGQSPLSEIVLPLIIKDKSIGVMVLWSTKSAFFREDHLQFLKPLAAQIAVSIDNASLYEEKSRHALTRQVITEVAKDMTAILELEELLSHIAVLIRRVIEYEILGIFLYREDSGIMELKVAIGYAEETVERWRNLPIGMGLLGYAALARKTLVSTDLLHDPRAISARTADGRWTQSEVAIPLISRHRLLGGLVVESCDPNYFQPARVEILETLGRQMAVSIDNAQLFKQLQTKEQKLEADFALAKDLQASMLPASMPDPEGFQIASLYKPAESLGGDYYDFMSLAESHLGLAIGDVSGKGVAAAMTMAATRSALRFAARLNSAPSQVLYHINRRLFRDLKKRTYVSLFYGVLDLHARVFRWSNGGHLPPILLRADGSLDELSKGGLPVALFDKSRYSSGQVQLFPGDLIFFYTDGLTEALNAAGEEFGRDRLIAVLKEYGARSPREILRQTNSEIRRFTRGSPQHDDITALAVKVTG
jgi:sigma-B regulation protein RsbU (phosphoserine phosphatase)